MTFLLFFHEMKTWIVLIRRQGKNFIFENRHVIFLQKIHTFNAFLYAHGYGCPWNKYTIYAFLLTTMKTWIILKTHKKMEDSRQKYLFQSCITKKHFDCMLIKIEDEMHPTWLMVSIKPNWDSFQYCQNNN